MTKLAISFIILSLCELIISFPTSNFERDAEELAGLFEGDIDITEEQRMMLSSQSRNGLIDTRYRWPSKTVPYHISTTNFSKEQRDYIREALITIESVSCIKFKSRSSEKDYIYVKGDSSGCSSNVGRIGGKQNLNLNASYKIGKGCLRKYTIVHEFLHALATVLSELNIIFTTNLKNEATLLLENGFYHMQSASNRDDYVRIQFENITPGHEKNFKKHDIGKISDFGVDYDYGSVLHYSRTAFSIDGSPTIVPIKNKTAVIGQREKISKSDILKLNKMYGCS